MVDCFVDLFIPIDCIQCSEMGVSPIAIVYPWPFHLLALTHLVSQHHLFPIPYDGTRVNHGSQTGRQVPHRTRNCRNRTRSRTGTVLCMYIYGLTIWSRCYGHSRFLWLLMVYSHPVKIAKNLCDVRETITTIDNLFIQQRFLNTQSPFLLAARLDCCQNIFVYYQITSTPRPKTQQ
jgi:hypothetical protein